MFTLGWYIKPKIVILAYSSLTYYLKILKRGCGVRVALQLF